ncbi:MAG: flagellar motor switch protein FliM [Bacillota bacterium]
MSEILTQKEIDSLIASLSTGGLAVEEQKKEDRPVRIYDFRRPDKFSKDQIRTLQMLHDNFARLLTTTFSAHFRTMVQTNIASVDQVTYGEYVRALKNPAIVAIVNLAPLPGNAVLDISHTIAFPMIDRLFGGAGQTNEHARALTEIEVIVMERIFVQFLDTLKEAWKNITEIKPKLETIESNPLFAQVVGSAEMAVLITFSAKLGEAVGSINFCLPYLVIEPVLPKLSAQHWFSTSQRTVAQGSPELLKKRLEDAAIPISVVLGETTISVRDLMGLQAGDVIQLDNPMTSDLKGFIGSRVKFRGRPGTVGRRMALSVTALADGEEEDYE